MTILTVLPVNTSSVVICIYCRIVSLSSEALELLFSCVTPNPDPTHHVYLTLTKWFFDLNKHNVLPFLWLLQRHTLPTFTLMFGSGRVRVKQSWSEMSDKRRSVVNPERDTGRLRCSLSLPAAVVNEDYRKVKKVNP